MHQRKNAFGNLKLWHFYQLHFLQSFMYLKYLIGGHGTQNVFEEIANDG
jgi:hypothetical protein